MKLRIKYFLIFMIISIAPFLFFTYYSYQRYTQSTYQRIYEFSENLFENAVSTLDNTLNAINQTISFLSFYGNDGSESIVQVLQAFSEDKEYSSYDIWKANRYCSSVFQNLLISNTYIEAICLFTPQGECFYCSNSPANTPAPNYLPMEDDWYKETVELNGKYYISKTVSSRMFSKSPDCIYFARSISDVYSHRFLGVILVACNSRILDLSTVNTMPELTKLSIMNERTGEVLYSNSADLDDNFEASNKGERSQVLTVSPLVLSAAFNYDSLFSEFNVTATLFLIIGFICIALIIIVGYFMTTGMVRPIEKLSSIMAHQGNATSRFSDPYMNRTDEIGTLYNEYSHMLEELDASIKRDYKDKLIVLDAQMKSLEARINSHFLFNTLESINSMAELEDNEQIATMSLALGNMFRYTIKTQSELVSISDELKHVEDYVAIQSIRFSNRFRLVKDIPEDLMNRRVLKLILQPLVENSLYHGLNYCAQGNQITIKIRKEEKNLIISVSDNGQGMDTKTLAALKNRLNEEASFTELGHRTRQSIGLKNIHSRIELYYGKGYGLDIFSEEQHGTTVSIRLPVIE